MSFDIISGITRDEDTAFAFLQEHRCIRSTPPNCSFCDGLMGWVKSGHGNKCVWRCLSHKTHQVSPRSGSFWQSSNLPLSKLLQLAFFWSYNIPSKTGKDFTGLNSSSVIQWYRYFREVCSHYFEENPIVIGGQNVIVEVGEFEIAKRKYRKNNFDSDSDFVSERWVFGGICPSTQEGFLVSVPDREAATLLPIIEQHVYPGSIIHTDGCASYNGITKMNVQPPYVHQIVKLSVNPVENQWRKANHKSKAMSGIQGDFVDSYLDEFQWRERFGRNGMDAFNNLLYHISQWYPTP